MFWDWKDQTGKVSLKVRPVWFCRDASEHVAFLKNDADKAISEFAIKVDNLDRKGRIITRGYSVFFYEVAAHSEHKDNFYLEKNLKIKTGFFKFIGDQNATPIVPTSISIRSSRWEVFRLTVNKMLCIEFAFVAALVSYPFLDKAGKLPDLTAASKIETCIQQKSEYRPQVFVEDSWVTARYFYSRPDTPTQLGYNQISLYADKNGHTASVGQGGYLAIIENGKVYYSGKYRRLVSEERWSDAGSAEPQREDIKSLKECTVQVFPERVYSPQ